MHKGITFSFSFGEHLLPFTSEHLLPFTSEHLLPFTSEHLLPFTSEHLLPFTSESFVFPSAVKKGIKIKIYRTVILAVFVWMLNVVS
jgi:membrane protein YqaA with SNARE-associated domain